MSHVGVAAAGNVLEVGGGDHRLPGVERSRSTSAWRRSRSSSLITSSSSIIGGGRAMGGDHLALGEQQREQGQPLLPLRAVGAQVVPVVLGGQVVPVGAVAGEAALEIGLEPLGQLARRALRLGGSRPRPVGRRPARRSRPSALARRANGSAISSIAARAVVHQRDAVARELGVPASQASRGRHVPRGSARSARFAGPAPARRGGGWPRGPATARRRTGRDGRGAARARP